MSDKDNSMFNEIMEQNFKFTTKSFMEYLAEAMTEARDAERERVVEITEFYKSLLALSKKQAKLFHLMSTEIVLGFEKENDPND